MRIRPSLLLATFLGVLAGPSAAGAADSRLVDLDDLARLREVSDPQLSPDGAWVAYTVLTHETKEDRRNRDIWMSSWDGKQSLRLTTGTESETTPRFTQNS